VDVDLYLRIFLEQRGYIPAMIGMSVSDKNRGYFLQGESMSLNPLPECLPLVGQTGIDQGKLPACDQIGGAVVCKIKHPGIY